MNHNSILQEDLDSVLKVEFIDWNAFAHKTFFITGATGLIGSMLIRSLNYANIKKNLDLTVLALVRDVQRGNEKFADILEDGMLQFVKGSVEELPILQKDVNYIIHAASQTASKEFVNHAVETIETTLLGTMNTLRLAKKTHVQSYVYLSSMEIYGYPKKGHKVVEKDSGSIDPLDLRNSYPIGKVMSEALCNAYAREYNIPAKICRLTQTFGPGVNYNDGRIFAYFGRCIKQHNNIILKTKGETERCYLYTADAVTAILTVLLNGQSGEAYNVADERTYCSIAEMAERVASNAGISVEYDIQDAATNGFLQTLFMNLDTSALRSLGWQAGGYSLVEMFNRMLMGWE